MYIYIYVYIYGHIANKTQPNILVFFHPHQASGADWRRHFLAEPRFHNHRITQFCMDYSLVIADIAIENCHLEFIMLIYLLKLMIQVVYGYVNLPRGFSGLQATIISWMLISSWLRFCG